MSGQRLLQGEIARMVRPGVWGFFIKEKDE
jgi:hypothetical protein